MFHGFGIRASQCMALQVYVITALGLLIGDCGFGLGLLTGA